MQPSALGKMIMTSSLYRLVWALKDAGKYPVKKMSPARAGASPRSINISVGQAYFSGIVRARSTATAVTLFCGEPSITRSE